MQQITTAPLPPTIRSLELEITGKCQAMCEHCAPASGPTGTDGTMTADDWRRVIDESAELGIETVQFIGGEPTLHRDLPALVEHALGRGIGVEVFSNLISVRRTVWDTLARPGVRIGTSYYSDLAVQHEQITKKRGSHQRTRANIVEVLNRGIPLRVGIVEVLEGQRVAEAEAELRALGVQQITVDRMRGIGRGARDTEPTPSELCGHCTKGRGAILPNGDVAGCVLSRFMTAGNVRQQPLADIVTGPKWADIAAVIPPAPVGAGCPPTTAATATQRTPSPAPPSMASSLPRPWEHPRELEIPRRRPRRQRHTPRLALARPRRHHPPASVRAPVVAERPRRLDPP
ncbi:radical SAM protein [Streptomyces sp. XD-27]|uniref:radical SAM protein n=1 Tax=Streptomyces sp. XD-27 TaxID=3062779 RepID=UPI00350E3D23